MTIRILADASLPDLPQAFPAPFEVTCYTHAEEVPGLLKNKHILLARASLPVTAALIQDSQLHYVATASSGSDKVDSSALQKAGITLLDAKGCNAQAVADYVMATLAYLQTKGLCVGKTAGIIGLGAVGSLVNQQLQALHFITSLYDPPKALTDPAFAAISLEALQDCSVICIHASLHDTPPFPSRNLLDAKFLHALKPATVIINAARGELIDEQALLEYGHHLIYCTDVYTNEPSINPDIVRIASLCTPHIAGHSQEAKRRAVFMLSEKLHACYQLPLPHWPSEDTALNPLIQRFDWEKSVLNHYNPLIETLLLKDNTSQHTFLTTRTQHTRRREFLWVD